MTRKPILDRPEKKQIVLKEGNFLKDPLGEKIDAVLLSDVMYGDSEAKIILQNAWNSLTQNGVLIVRGYYADPERSGPLFGALFAVKNLVDDPKRNIMTISMLEKNVREIGFKPNKIFGRDLCYAAASHKPLKIGVRLLKFHHHKCVNLVKSIKEERIWLQSK